MLSLKRHVYDVSLLLSRYRPNVILISETVRLRPMSEVEILGKQNWGL